MGVVPNNPNDYGKNKSKEWSAPTLNDFTDETWDDLSKSEQRKIASCFAWTPQNPPENFSDLKLPHHFPNGTLSWHGVRAAMAALHGARGGVDIPSDDKKTVYNHLAAHYREFDEKPPEQDAQFTRFTFDCSLADAASFADGIDAEPTLTDEERANNVHEAILCAGDVIMNGKLVLGETRTINGETLKGIKAAVPTLDNKWHNIDHKRELEYIIGKHVEGGSTWDSKLQAVRTKIQMFPDAEHFDTWQTYYERCKEAGLAPNISMEVFGYVTPVTFAELPEDIRYKLTDMYGGFDPDAQIPVVHHAEFAGSATVTEGACNPDNGGCGFVASKEQHQFNQPQKEDTNMSTQDCDHEEQIAELKQKLEQKEELITELRSNLETAKDELERYAQEEYERVLAKLKELYSDYEPADDATIGDLKADYELLKNAAEHITNESETDTSHAADDGNEGGAQRHSARADIDEEEQAEEGKYTNLSENDKKMAKALNKLA